MILQRRRNFYEKYVKRLLDIISSLIIIIIFSWLYIIIALIVRCKMGSPILFEQLRPGMIDAETGNERIFKIYKFRTMTDAKDSNGNLLPDEQRLPTFGRILRATSLDELPELFNILKGDMSLIGPRPQLVRDMVFMTEKQRMRHTAMPGLTGLAQVNGRNAIDWEQRISYDLEYVENVNFVNDLRILFKTIKVLLLHEGITEEGNATATDYGDYLLSKGLIAKAEYDKKQEFAKELLAKKRL